MAGLGTDDKDGRAIDQVIGRRLRLRRRELGFTQTTVASGLGVTFQQVQKYESGANRLSAAQLYRVSQVLLTNPAWFFEDFQGANSS